jgi:3-oxoacyl-[acyl-carrier protein] reductase
MRTALIVGGASGIGAASARLMAKEGYRVAVADLSSDTAKAIVTSLPGTAHGSYSINIDNEAGVAPLFDAVEREMSPVAVLIVAAGTAGLVEGKRPTLRATTVENWDQIFAVNTRGPFLCIREFFRRREKTSVKDGRVVLIASMAAQILAVNSPPAYVASKGALLALTKVAAAEGAKMGITVNAVAPGAIDTPMLRSAMPPERDATYFANSVAGRAGSAEEVANAILFLASPAASYVNGACIDVNGGFAMR